MRLPKTILSILLVVALLCGMTFVSLAEEKITVRAAWWGGTARNDMMNAIYDLYESEHPNVTIEREYGTWEDYWIRYSTQVAGGNAPDVIQFTDRELESYVALDAVEPLTAYVDNGTIDVSQFSEASLSASSVDGVLYEMPMGLSTPIIEYNATMIENAGMELPKMDMTWEEFAAYCIQLKDSGKLPADTYVLRDECGASGGGAHHWFYSFLRQKGEDLSLNADGELAFTLESVVEWLTWWNDMRVAGVVPPYTLTAEYIAKPKEERELVKGAVVMHSVAGNQAKIYQRNMTDTCGIIRLPSMPDGANLHGEVIAGAYIGVSSTSKHKDVAADIVNFFVNDERACKIFKCEQGIYGNIAMQEAVAADVDPLDLIVTECLNETLKSIPAPTPYANGTTAVITLLQSMNESVVYNVMSIEDAAKDFMKEAKKAFEDAM